MSYKTKQEIPKYVPKADKAMQEKMQQNVKFRRGIEPEEMHREGGNRVPDQGGAHKK